MPWENEFDPNDEFLSLKTLQMKLLEEQIDKKLFLDVPEELIAYMQYCYNLSYLRTLIIVI